MELLRGVGGNMESTWHTAQVSYPYYFICPKQKLYFSL